MAKKTDQDAFKAWVEQVSSTLPDEKKNLLKSVVEDDVLSKQVFSGFMGEKFLYQRLNEVKQAEERLAKEKQEAAAQAGQLHGWYQTARTEYDQALKESAGLRKYMEELGLDPPKAGESAREPVSRKDERADQLAERLDRIDSTLPTFLGAMARIVQRSIKDNIDIDPNEIISYSTKNGVSPYQAYDELTYQTRFERAEKTRTEALEKAKQEGREEGKRDALAQTQSFDHVRPAGPNIFDILNNETKKTDAARVDAAVKAFREEAAGVA